MNLATRSCKRSCRYNQLDEDLSGDDDSADDNNSEIDEDDLLSFLDSEQKLIKSEKKSGSVPREIVTERIRDDRKYNRYIYLRIICNSERPCDICIKKKKNCIN